MPKSEETEFEQMTVAEQILYVQRLWDRIAENSEDVEITEPQRDELDRRLDRHDENPDETLSRREVFDSLGDDA